MTKKHFIALADAIREHNAEADPETEFELGTAFRQCHIETLAQLCSEQNDRFDRERWLGYIAGNNGKNGGAVKKTL